MPQFIQTQVQWLCKWPVVNVTWQRVKWREGLLGWGQSGGQRGHGDLLRVILLADHTDHTRPLAWPQLLDPPDAEQEPLLVTEHEEPDVLKVLDGDAEDVLDGGVSLLHEVGGVHGEVEDVHHVLHTLGNLLRQPVLETEFVYFCLELLPMMWLFNPDGSQVLGGPAALILKLTDSIIVRWFILENKSIGEKIGEIFPNMKMKVWTYFQNSKQSLVIYVLYCHSDSSSVTHQRLSALYHQRWIRNIHGKFRVEMWKWCKFNLCLRKTWQTI